MIRKSQGWIAFAVAFAVSAESGATMGMWGSGMYGGMQMCPYGTQAGAGAISASDEMKEIQETQQEIAEEIREKKVELRKLGGEIRESERYLRKYLRDEAVADIKLHVVSGKQCLEWTGRDGEPALGPGAKVEKKDDQPSTAAPLDGRRDTTVDNRVSPETLTGFTAADWRGACSIQTGNRQLVSRRVCKTVGAITTSPQALHPTDEDSCTTNVDRYQKATARRAQLSREIERLTAERNQLKKDYRLASREFKKDLKDGLYDDYEGTEGTVCIDCDFKRRQTYDKGVNWGQLFAGIAGGAAVIYAGSRQTKMIAEYNAAQGFPTENNYAAYVPAGIGMMMNGVAGAIGGGTGRGSFACNGGINGSAYHPLWGYPMNMQGGLNAGGGMFIPGITPWGYNGYPYGMGYPGMGMAGMGVAGMGYPGMGMAGMGVAGMGYPGMGMAGMGVAGMGYPGMGMAGMGYPGMGMAGGVGMAGMGMGYDAMGQLQMQQQMMQYQMQAQQMYMQQQQQALQNEMRRQQTLRSLQTELSSLMMRIQQVQYGGYGGGYGGIGAGGSIGIGIGGSIGIGGNVQYNGNGSYLYNSYPQTGVGGGGTGCVGLSCTPTGVPNGINTNGPTR